MRTLIFTFLLLAINAIGAPQPTVYLNAWSTNRSVLPVFGDNNLGVSNRIAGPGGGTNWNFYGIGPNTVARLTDVTNSGNGLFVKKFNGPSDGQIATNLSVINSLNWPAAPSYVSLALGGLDILHIAPSETIWDSGENFNTPYKLTWRNDPFITLDFLASTMTIGEGTDWGTLYIPHNQTNSGTMDVAGDLTAYGALIAANGFNVSAGLSSFNTGIKLNSLTPSRLMAITSAGYATNTTTIDEAYVLSLQTQLTAATNALVTASNVLNLAIANTNAFIRTNVGVGTFTTLYSATNKPLTTTSVGQTIVGNSSQTGDLFQWLNSGGTTNGWMDSSGGMHFGVGNQLIFWTNGNQFSSGNWTNTGNIIFGTPDRVTIGGSGVIMGNGKYVGWTAAANPFGGTPDVTLYRVGVNLIGVGTTANTGVAGLNVSNLTSSGVITNYGTVYLPTNNAPTKTISSGGLHVLTLGKGWTNDLGGRADLVMHVKFTDAATGDPSFAFTNTTSGVSWTNGIAFGIVGTDTRTIVEPDINPSDTGSLTDLSGTGATVVILQAWWHVK